MTAVTVAGQCRERSPADVAIFGAAAERFAPRFLEQEAGEALLAEALTAGVAESEASLRTGEGSAAFRVALWRQRGGDRIRLIASFAHQAEPPAARAGVPLEAVERFGSAIRPALTAVTGLAGELREEAEGPAAGHAGDILAAAWRMTRLVDDLMLIGELGTARAPLRMAEVDLERLIRRVLRLAGPLAEATGVTLNAVTERLPGVVADETALWSLLEALIGATAARAGQGGEVRLVCRCAEGAGGLEIRFENSGCGAPRPAEAELLRHSAELAAANGALLETAEGAVRLVFPKRRCLSPV